MTGMSPVTPQPPSKPSMPRPTEGLMYRRMDVSRPNDAYAPADALLTCHAAALHGETFRVVHHKHCLPGPRVLLPNSYRGITGDTHATTRNLGPMSLLLTKIGLAVSSPMTQVFFGCGAGVAWGFGLRQSIHSTMLQTRALRTLRKEAHAIAQTPTRLADTTDRNALLRINRTTRAESQVRRAFGGLVASAATFGIGLGWVFRTIAASSHTPALTLAAHPVLATCFPLLALSNAGLAAYETVACAKTFVAARRVKRAHWPHVLGHEQEVRGLLHARHIERRWCHFGNAATHVLVAVGAPLTFFIGPFGLAVLLPGVFGNLAVDVADQRIIHYPKQLTLPQQLRLGHRAALGAEIVHAQGQYRNLYRLRRERHKQYPRGLGINIVRPFARSMRALRTWIHRSQMAHGGACEATLARIAAEQHTLDRQRLHDTWRLRVQGHHTANDLAALHLTVAAYNPHAWQAKAHGSLAALYALLRATNLCEPFAKHVLEDKRLRRRLQKSDAAHIMRLQPKRWHLDVQALLVQSSTIVDLPLTRRLLAHGEEVLLVEGKNAAMYRRRQLLDMLDAQLAQSSR